MAVKAIPQGNLSYTQGETGKISFIRVFQYQRPTPGSKLLKNDLGFITLPLPDNMPVDTYSMDIGAENLGVVGGLATGPKQLELTRLKNTIKERLEGQGVSGDIVAAATGAIALAPGIADLTSLGPIQIGETAQAFGGVVRNPHTALLFNNVNLRHFNFNWRLSPRNSAQSLALDRIIKTLKTIMHPSLQAGGFALDYPNLVTIDFKNESEGILKVDYAFISDLQINPTPQGQAYYKNGYPVAVDLSMTVKEIRIKTAEDFDFTKGAQQSGGVR